MADQFTTYGTAQVMVANITYNEASDLNERIAQVKGCRALLLTRPQSIMPILRRCLR